MYKAELKFVSAFVLANRRLHNSIQKMMLLNWSRNGQLTEGNLRGSAQNVSDVFEKESCTRRLLELFTFPGQWVLDLSESTCGKETLNEY